MLIFTITIISISIFRNKIPIHRKKVCEFSWYSKKFLYLCDVKIKSSLWQPIAFMQILKARWGCHLLNHNRTYRQFLGKSGLISVISVKAVHGFDWGYFFNIYYLRIFNIFIEFFFYPIRYLFNIKNNYSKKN